MGRGWLAPSCRQWDLCTSGVSDAVPGAPPHPSTALTRSACFMFATLGIWDLLKSDLPVAEKQCKFGFKAVKGRALQYHWEQV